MKRAARTARQVRTADVPSALVEARAGLTHGAATVVVSPVPSASAARELLATVDGVRGVESAHLVAHRGAVLTIGLRTGRPVALAAELRMRLGARLGTCRAEDGRLELVLAGVPDPTAGRRSRGFDHQVVVRQADAWSGVPAPAHRTRRGFDECVAVQCGPAISRVRRPQRPALTAGV